MLTGAEFVFDLMLWTFVHGRFVGLPRQHPMPLPTIEYVEPAGMAPELENAPPMVGRYIPATMTIRLKAECEVEMSKACIATLVHELVHHLSRLTKRKFDCKGSEERLAYLTSYRWALDYAPEIMNEIALDKMTWFFATTCFEEQP